MKHQGSCLCGDVAFELAGTFNRFYLCHCEYCRKGTGSAHAANLFSRDASLTWLRGEENVQSFKLPETRHVRSFCNTCGSAMPTVVADHNLTVVPAGCLDCDVSVLPSGHLFMGSRANWDESLETVKAFDGFPE